MFGIVNVFVLLLGFSDCGKILCIFPTPFYSHQSFFQPIWRELAERGHDVTVITTNPITNLTKVKQIDLSFTYELVFEKHNMEEVINTESNLLVLMKHVFFVMNNMTEEQLKHEEIQELINSDEKFDLIIAEVHVPAWLGFGKKYGCPVIGITSMEPSNNLRSLMGSINNPILTPHINLPFGNDLNFFERVTSEKIIRRYLNDPNINLLAIFSNISLLFTNVIPGFNKVAPSVPAIVQLNGLQIKPPGEIPEDIKTFLDGACDGAIFFSLGSNVKSSLLSEEKRRMLLEVFKEIPYRVLWKFEQSVKNLPANVKTVQWVPQQDIMRHKNLKLFITQGGIQSIEEAIRFNIPILGIPFFGDQFHNLKRVEYLDIGASLHFKNWNASLLKQSILRVAGNKTYRDNLKEMSDLLTEQPLKSLDKAVWWVEYVLKYGGAHHLRSPLANMPFYRYYLVDVILFLAIGIIFLLSVLKFVIKRLWRAKSIKSKLE